MAVNPLLDPSFHVRWSAVRAEHVVPAVAEALGRAQAAIARIASLPIAEVSYASVFTALEEAQDELTVVWGRVTHLQSVADSPALRDAHNEMLPKVSAFFASIPLNASLWERVRTCGGLPETRAMSGIRRRFVEGTTKDFVQAGANLPADKRARLEAIQAELAQLTQKYSENVLDSTNAWQLVVPPEDEVRLAGLPARAKAEARRSAESKGLAGWRFTLHMPSQEPFMTYVEDADLRRTMWLGAIAVGGSGAHDNGGLVAQILRLRAEKAALLGHAHFADAVLARRMAGSGARALAFIGDFQLRAAPAFARECRELEAYKAQQTGAAPGRLAPWELMFWSERLRRERYAFDEEALRPYFPMDRVIAGLFEVARRVFGLRIVEAPAGAADVWHADVRFYAMFDAADRHVGSFYADWYPREAKRGGAWMNYLLTGGPRPDGTRAPHLGLICGNMTPPVDGRPALLTHREVETVFHEFGHLLHHLLGEVEIKALNGVNVAWDFVELPSQIMENWTWEREGLDLFARHHETGAAIPEEIFGKMVAARNFRSACATMRQVAFAKMDLLLHTTPDGFAGAGDLEPRVRAMIEECLVPTEPPAPTIVRRFTHLFADPVGYAAGYYSYKWAEVLDADAFTRFKREGVFSREVGTRFVEAILSRGNSAEPAELFREFMGRDPEPQALLERCGLA